MTTTTSRLIESVAQEQAARAVKQLRRQALKLVRELGLDTGAVEVALLYRFDRAVRAEVDCAGRELRAAYLSSRTRGQGIQQLIEATGLTRTGVLGLFGASAEWTRRQRAREAGADRRGQQ